MVPRWIAVLLLVTATWIAGFTAVTPAYAQEGGAAAAEANPHADSSYAAKFLTTDNAVGTALIWVCLFLSVAIFALIIQVSLQCRASTYMPQELVDNLERLITEKNFREAIDLANADPSPFGQVMKAALNEAPRGYTAMEMAIEEVADGIGNTRIRKLVWFELAGAAGPMIGLFGTVFGMIISFYTLVSLGGAPKPAELAGGIATALVCTFWGLIVGIPGVVSGSLFRVIVESRTAEAIAKGKELIAAFRPRAAKPKPAAAPAAAASPKPA